MEGHHFGGIHWFLFLVPSRELTYPPDKAYFKMMFLFPRWDMLVCWRVSDQIIQIVSRKTGVHRRNPRWRKKTSHPGARWVESTRDSRNRWGEQLEVTRRTTPWKINMEATNHPFRRENSSKPPWFCSMLIFRGVGGGNSNMFYFQSEPWGNDSEMIQL